MNKLRTEFQREMYRLPDWIDSTSSIHHNLWHSMLDCNDILLILVVNRILKDKSIEKIAIKFDEYMVELLKIDPQHHLEIAIYFTAMLDYLEARCVEEEEYEAASNLTRFKTTYFQNMTTYENDKE